MKDDFCDPFLVLIIASKIVSLASKPYLLRASKWILK